jgi:hypothetical protein
MQNNNHQCKHLKTDCKNLQENYNPHKFASLREDTKTYVGNQQTAYTPAAFLCVNSCEHTIEACDTTTKKVTKIEQYIAFIILSA